MRLLITLSALSVLQHTQGYYELVEELGCYDSDFRLHCAPHDSQILILEAFFTADDSYLSPIHTSCANPGVTSNFTGHYTRLNIRNAFNKRCSGKNLCSFSLLEDHPDAVRWGAGAIYLRYACMDEAHILKTCSAVVSISGEGFVQTPGYPKFYVGGRPCKWTLKAPSHKKVQIQFLDIALRGVGPQERSCQDWLHVTEHGLDMVATCGDVWDPQVITSAGSELNITLTSASVNLFPKRGLLFHYKAVGCKLPDFVQDGYLVTNNDSLLHFRCNVGYVFPDSGSRDRIIYCYESSADYPVPSCVYVGTDNASADPKDVFKMNLTSDATAKQNPPDDAIISDVVVPCLIVGVLFVANAFILAAIYIYKKRLLSGGQDPWENNLMEDADKTNSGSDKSQNARTTN